MLKPIIPQDKIERLRSFINEAETILLIGHLSPDGDAMGSTLAMREVLLAAGKNAYIVTPDAPLQYLMFIPGSKEIICGKKYKEFTAELFGKADLILCMDFNTPSRIDHLEPLLRSSKAKKVLIDHHLGPEDFCDIEISYPSECSTCMLTFRVIAQLGWMNWLNRNAAEAICTGMMTDTGNFTYSDSDPDIYVVLAELMRRGADKDRIYKLAFNTKTADRFRLEAYALNNKLTLFPEKRAALITLTLEELNRFNYKPGNTEGLVNMPLAIPEILYVVFMREGNDYVKVSCRSEGDIPVNKMCSEYFGGGGHKNAAGGEFHGTLDEAVELFKKAMDEFERFLPAE